MHAASPRYVRLAAAATVRLALTAVDGGIGGLRRTLSSPFTRGLRNRDLHAGRQTQLTINDDALARLDGAIGKGGDGLVLIKHLDLTHLRFHLIVDNKHVALVLADVHRLARDHCHLLRSE